MAECHHYCSTVLYLLCFNPNYNQTSSVPANNDIQPQIYQLFDNNSWQLKLLLLLKLIIFCAPINQIQNATMSQQTTLPTLLKMTFHAQNG